MARVHPGVFDDARAVIAKAIRDGGSDVLKFPAVAAEVILSRLERAGIVLSRDAKSEVA